MKIPNLRKAKGRNGVSLHGYLTLFTGEADGFYVQIAYPLNFQKFRSIIYCNDEYSSDSISQQRLGCESFRRWCHK